MIGSAGNADVYDVKQYATPPTSPSGTSWSDAFPSIDAAFAAVTFEDDDQRWVAASGDALPLDGAPGLPEGFAAMSSASGFTITPSDLAAALGFDTIESLAAWLGTLTPETRAAVLDALTVAGGGM